MTDRNSVRAGVFKDLVQANRVIARLVAAGFTKEQITVIAPEAHRGRFEQYRRELPSGSHTGSTAVGGAAIGALIGGLAALGGIVATGGSALLIAGPLLGTGAGAGTFIGAMMSRGFEHETANYYDQALQKGNILIAVHDDTEHKKERLAVAERILADSGTEAVAMPEG